MEDHVYSRHSTMNRNEECMINERMIKSEFLKPMDKPLDLKQNVITDKTMKQEIPVAVLNAMRATFYKEEKYDSGYDSSNRLNFDSKPHIQVKNGLQTSDNHPRKLTIPSSELVHTNVGNNITNGHNLFYSTMMAIEGQAFLPANDQKTYAADLSTLYSGGFVQSQNAGAIQTSEEVVVVSTEMSSDSGAEPVKCGPNDCPVCQKPFINKHNLTKHLNLHAGTEKFQCSVCQKVFSEKGNLTKHMNIHTGQKTYNCPICHKGFFWLSSLSKHKALHTGETIGKFKCDVCKKTFGEKGNLTKHMNLHTGNRMFACDVCDKCYYWKSSLIIHKTIHTGHKMYVCPTCNKPFRWKASYNKHVSAHLQSSWSTDQRSTI